MLSSFTTFIMEDLTPLITQTQGFLRKLYSENGEKVIEVRKIIIHVCFIITTLKKK